MFPRSPKVDEERRRKAKICAQGFALAYRNSSRNEPAPMEAEEQQHSAEHHHHSPELTQQTPEDPPPLIRRSGRQRTERAAQTRSARRVPQPSVEEQHQNEAHDRRRAEIARGKRVVVEEEEVHVDEPMYEEPVEEEQVVEEEMMEEEDVPIPKAVSKRGKKTPSTKKFIQYLKELSFERTKHPHGETMDVLGIREDVEFLFDMCGLTRYMTYAFESYQNYTCELLASLEVHFFSAQGEEEAGRGFGYATFTVGGRDYSLTIKELDNLYGFPSKEGLEPDFDKLELTQFWNTIAAPGDFHSSRCKSSSIRSPVLRYFHQCIAHTFYAKKVTGPINDSELQMMDEALKSVLRKTKNGRVMEGDRANTSLTVLFLDYLMGLKDYAAQLHKMKRKGSIGIGGMITPMLVAAGIDLGGPDRSPEWIDIAYLRKKNILDKTTPSGVHIYLFNHPDEGSSRLLLPCTNYTTIRNGENINFYPPIHALYDAPENIPPPRQEPPHPGYDETDEQPQDEASEYFPERFHFDPYVATRQSRSERAAHQRVGMLQGLAKLQGKVAKSLTKKVESLAHAVKEMGLQIKELQRKHKSPPPSSENDRVVRRSDSTSMAYRFERSENPVEPSQGPSFEPSRASSYEPREASTTKHRKKVKTKRRNAPQAEQSTSERYSAKQLDVPNEYNPPPSNAPAYTRESMDEFARIYFS